MGGPMDETTTTLTDDLYVAVRRYLASLDESRHLPQARIAALLRIGNLDGEPAAAIRAAIERGALYGAGLRDLVGRHALGGNELALFIMRDVLAWPVADAARVCGTDARTARKRIAAARSRVGLAADAARATVGQWLVTELIAPPTRALQLELFQHAMMSGDRVPPGESKEIS